MRFLRFIGRVNVGKRAVCRNLAFLLDFVFEHVKIPKVTCDQSPPGKTGDELIRVKQAIHGKFEPLGKFLVEHLQSPVELSEESRVRPECRTSGFVLQTKLFVPLSVVRNLLERGRTHGDDLFVVVQIVKLSFRSALFRVPKKLKRAFPSFQKMFDINAIM